MTEDNREANALDELARAQQSLDAAAALIAAGLHADAVSRAYYGAYHHLRALLYSRGLEPRSHAGALHLLNVEFIRPGLLPSANNRLLSGLQRSVASHACTAPSCREHHEPPRRRHPPVVPADTPRSRARRHPVPARTPWRTPGLADISDRTPDDEDDAHAVSRPSPRSAVARCAGGSSSAS